MLMLFECGMYFSADIESSLNLCVVYRRAACECGCQCVDRGSIYGLISKPKILKILRNRKMVE